MKKQESPTSDEGNAPMHIEVGDFLVNKIEVFVRQVLSIDTDGVYSLQFALDDGAPRGTSNCSLSALRQWTKRRATPEEIAQMQVVAAFAEEIQSERHFVEIALRSATDEQIRQEAKRRGIF